MTANHFLKYTVDPAVQCFRVLDAFAEGKIVANTLLHPIRPIHRRPLFKLFRWQYHGLDARLCRMATGIIWEFINLPNGGKRFDSDETIGLTPAPASNRRVQFGWQVLFRRSDGAESLGWKISGVQRPGLIAGRGTVAVLKNKSAAPAPALDRCGIDGEWWFGSRWTARFWNSCSPRGEGARPR